MPEDGEFANNEVSDGTLSDRKSALSAARSEDNSPSGSDRALLESGGFWGGINVTGRNKYYSYRYTVSTK